MLFGGIINLLIAWICCTFLVIQTEGFIYSCYIVVLVGGLVLLGFIINVNGGGTILLAVLVLFMVPGNVVDLMIPFFLVMVLLVVFL